MSGPRFIEGESFTEALRLEFEAITLSGYENHEWLALKPFQRDNWRSFAQGKAPTHKSAEASLAAKEAELKALRQALVNQNDVLRSAYQIAARKGAQTEWEGFTLRAGSVLHFHHEEVEAARAALSEMQR